MKLLKSMVFLGAIAVCAMAAVRSASGPVGIYGMIERVAFEPNEAAPDRIRIWGAFAYVNGGLERPLDTSVPVRGYMHFKLPTLAPGTVDRSQIESIKKEWMDIKSVAGTGQAIGFGSWFYVGRFTELHPNASSASTAYILVNTPRGSTQADFKVRADSEPPGVPITYQTNVGVVRLSEASHGEIVRQLRAAIRRD